jgi:hypothetical protein
MQPTTIPFVVTYLLLMVPTYILPYFGSNSTLVNAFSTALGMGPTPQWWAHAWVLTLLCLLAWARSGVMGRAWLPILPILASVFDLTPMLSSIPLMPTLLHIGGILAGVIGTLPVSNTGSTTHQAGLNRKVRNAALATTLCAIGGALLFMATAGRSVTRMAPDAPSSTKASPATPPPAPAPTLTLPPLSPPPAAVEAAPPPAAPAAPATPTTPASDAPQKKAHRPPVAKQQANAADEKNTKPAASGTTTRYIKLND